MRQRVIFVGVRGDLAEKFGAVPAFPAPLAYRYSVTDAIGDLIYPWEKPEKPEKPWPTVTSHIAGKTGFNPPRKILIRHGSGFGKESLRDEGDISRFAIGKEWDKLRPGQKSKKYLNLARAHPEDPSPTVTASGGEPSIASVTHPVERRKFTIAELKRICAFSDDFILKGNYSQQWARLGNSVPPIMAFKIAEAIRDNILDKLPR